MWNMVTGRKILQVTGWMFINIAENMEMDKLLAGHFILDLDLDLGLDRFIHVFALDL